MGTGSASEAEFAVSDYEQISSLHEWLGSVPGAQVNRVPATPRPGELGAVDVLTVLAGSGGLIAAIRVIPDFLRSRRSNVSITVTLKGKKVTVTASNINDVIPILERTINNE
jgi:Effector Associated Constant Component 1